MSFHYEHLLKNNFCKATGGVTEALGRLNEKGVILVAGAANDNKESCNVLPASLPNVISVGATRCDFGLFGSTCKEKRGYKEELLHERVKWASNYSKDEKCLTLVAPGQDLLTYVDGKAELGDGTSYASPQVAGLVALITAVKSDASYEYVKRLMRENADPILLDDDPEPTIRDLIFYRINVRRTIEALLREQMGAKIPSNCKSFNSTDSSPNNVLRFADAYASTAVFANYPDGFIYDFEKGELTKIPRDSAKYSDLSDFSIWDKDILFHCTLKSGEKRTCKYSIDQLNFEEFAFKSISQGGYGLDLNYWNGNVTYFPIDADPFQLFSHDYRSMRPSKGIDVPGLSLLRPSLPILDQFSPTTLIYDPSVLGRKLYLYDQKDGLKEIPISDPIYSYSMTNSGIALFSAGKSVFNVSPIYKLDTTTRNLSTVPVPLNEIDFGKDPIDSTYIPFFNGQFATYSAQSKKTVYVWNVNTGAKDLEVTIADNEKLGYPRPVALKGGTLTLSVEIISGTRTYSCPIK